VRQIKITQTSNADMNIGIPKYLTAVEWLKDMLEWNYGDPQMLEITWENLDDLLERAKQMEKRQIVDSYLDGRAHQESSKDSEWYNLTHEDYYNKTYGKSI